MTVTLDFFTGYVLPQLRAEHKTVEALTKACQLFIDQNAVQDAEGNPVEITAIDLSSTAGEPAQAGPEEGAAAEAGVAKAVAAAVTKELDARDRKGGAHRKNMRQRFTVEVGPSTIETDRKRGWRDYDEFVGAVIEHGTPNARKGEENVKRLHYRTKAPTGGSVQEATAYGFLLPPEFATEIWQKTLEVGDLENVCAKCDRWPVRDEQLELIAWDETSRVTGSRYGGIRGYWTGEADQMTGVKGKTRKLKLDMHEFTILCYLTNRLLKSSQGGMLQSKYAEAAAAEIMWEFCNACFRGEGSAKPLGVIGAAGTLEIAKETNQTAATIWRQNITKMWARMLPSARVGASWYINVDCEPTLEEMSLAVGVGGVPVYLPNGGIADAPYARLKGRPVVPVEWCSTVGTAGDIVLANWDWYCLGVKESIDSEVSIHLRFDYNETALRYVTQTDGQPWLASKITPANGTNTLAPFVTLAARA